MSSSEASVDRLTKAYIRIREKRSENKTKFDAEDAKLRKQQDRIAAALLEHCKEHNVDSVRTSEGAFYRTVKTRYWTNDWDAMYEFVKQHGVLEFFDKRLNQSNVRQFLEENPDVLPPGLNASSEYTVSVRKR